MEITARDALVAVLGQASSARNAACGQCGMLVEPAMAFHPYLYCVMFKQGFLNPAKFLEGQHFIPDPAHWGEDAPAKQAAAASVRRA